MSTTGVTVYKHYCSHGGMLYGVYFDVEHGCEPEEIEEITGSHNCCASSSESDLKVEDECCTSNVQMYQIDTDLAVSDSKIDLINQFSFTFSSSILFSILEFKEVSTSNKAPPVLSTLERLSLFQMYLI